MTMESKEEPPALEIDSVTKRFGQNVALDNVSFSVRQGEIRGVIGRNGAGKSTLMGIASGFLAPDEGRVVVGGRDADAMDRQEYRDVAGMVHQHSTLVRSMTIAENLALGRWNARRLGLINWETLNHKTQNLLDEWDTELNATQLVDDLSLAERQLVEIIRELARGVELIILDEPTSRLEKSDITELFANVRRLSARGAAVIYISHHLAEIHELCDSVSTLRDGQLVRTCRVANVGETDLVDDMIGARAEARFTRLDPLPLNAETPVRLELDEVAGEELAPLSLQVRAGECVGIAGLIGSGKEELGLILGGLTTRTGGTTLVDGAPLASRVRGALESGIGFLPPDRHESGLVMSMNIQDNITMTIWDKLQDSLGFLHRTPLGRRSSELATHTDVTTIGDHQQPVGMLSGGNQQKVAIGRATARDPRVLVLMNPTTGVDVASKRTIYELLRRQLGLGIAMVLISDEPDEFTFCNRVLAMFQGHVVKELDDPADEAGLVAAIEGVGASNVHS